MPTHSGYRICKCCNHPGHVRGCRGCKHSGAPGFHLLITLPREQNPEQHEDSVVLDRVLYTWWSLDRVFAQYRKAYPHCDVEVKRLP